MRIGSLFSGAGGLDMAVEQVCGGHVVWHAEIDKAASKVLAYRWPGVPNLGDISGIDWAAVPPVDVLCGGFPCQDVSAAGKRAGIKDGTRSGLWAVFADAIDELRPPIVVIENVRGLLSAAAHRMEPDETGLGNGAGGPVLRAAGAVLGDLADLGYDAQWATVSAASVGAPHRRERVFIVATDTHSIWARDNTPCGICRCADLIADSPRNGRDEGRAESARIVGGSDAAVSGDGPVELLPTPTSRDHKGRNQRDDDTCLAGALLPTPNASDCTGGGAHPDKREGHSRQLIDYALLDGTTEWGKYAPAIRRWEQVTRPAPPPTEPNKNGNPRLSAAFSEWLMGWPDGWVTDPAIGISRNDQLRIVGNGVCPQQAAAALRMLMQIGVAVA